jgi:rod shape-determining protein MreD
LLAGAGRDVADLRLSQDFQGLNMVKFLFLGFLLSGLSALEFAVQALPMGELWVPDAALLVLFIYAIHGKGRFLSSFCFLCGWLRGIGLSESAGFYILIYLFMGHFLARTRTYFFIERPLTQLTLCLVMSMIYLLFQWACRYVGLLPELLWPSTVPLICSCCAAVCLVPVMGPLYNRLTLVRKLLHP